MKKVSFGGVVPKEKLGLWKPIGAASSTSKEKVEETCTIHTKPVEDTNTNKVNTNQVDTNNVNTNNTIDNVNNTTDKTNTESSQNKTNTSTQKPSTENKRQ